MPITTFDTLKYVRRLQEAGMPVDQAEIQAEVLTEAFNVNLESLVTKDYLAAQMAEQRAYMDSRFAEQDAKFDKRFAEQDAKFDKRFAEQNAKFDRRFAEIDARLETLRADFDGKFRTLYVMSSILLAAVLLPWLERLLAL
jgi:ABC-type phosphate transport system auxiliary subunit